MEGVYCPRKINSGSVEKEKCQIQLAKYLGVSESKRVENKAEDIFFSLFISKKIFN